MVNLEKIKEAMALHYEEDQSRVFIEVEAPTLDEALIDAAIQLDASSRDINYEVIQRGTTSFLSLNKRNWIIRAYEIQKKSRKKKRDAADAGGDGSAASSVPIIEDKNGDAFVFCSPDGVYLKVIPPVGNGSHATVKEAIDRIRERGLTGISEEMIAPVVDKESGTLTKITSFIHNPAQDALMAVDITDQEMKASLYVTPPGNNGADLSVDMIVAFLKNNRVVAGIDEKRIQEFVDRPIYKQNYLVAEGIKPQDGADAHILYNFETDRSKIHLKETASGNVDFKELNIVQNVVESQPLAQKFLQNAEKLVKLLLVSI